MDIGPKQAELWVFFLYLTVFLPVFQMHAMLESMKPERKC